MNQTSPLKNVAIVHDFLVQEGGAERVLESLARLFPNAPIYTLIFDKKRFQKKFEGHKIIPSALNKLPGSARSYQWYLPFMPGAIESFNLSRYDLVISSSSAFAKGILTQPNMLSVCYCHTPTRYLWTDTHAYVRDLKIPYVVKKLLPFTLTKLRAWDYLSAQRPTAFIANSENVRKRIKKYYGRDSTVIYPPVMVDEFKKIENGGGDYFLAGGRLVAYKRFDIVVKAFNKLGIPLKIFGEGPLYKDLKSLSKKKIEFLGWVEKKNLSSLYSGARAFLNPQEEDFGITMVEAMAAGTPVIAYKAGGALEIVKPNVNGVFFDEQTWEALADTVVRFKREDFTSEVVSESARIFSEENFASSLTSFLTALSENHAKNSG